MDAMGWCEMTVITVGCFFTPRVSPISRFFFDQDMHPGKIPRGTLRMGGLVQMIFPFQLDDFFRFHVNFQGCNKLLWNPPPPHK